jgi:hypothetical protein
MRTEYPECLALSRRDCLRIAGLRMTGLGLLGFGMSGWMPLLAAEAVADPARRRQCVLLWMSGGPSQIDTFDLKPGHENGGPYREIATAAPGLKISEHLPKLAAEARHLAVIRGLSSKEGDHSRGTYLMRTGHQPTGPIRFPSLGSLISKELGEAGELPAYVSIAPNTTFSPDAFAAGFLGPRFAPLTVAATTGFQQVQTPAAAGGFAELGVDDLKPATGVESSRADGRLDLWRSLQDDFLGRHRTASPLAHDTAYRQAVRMMRSKAARAFNLADEPQSVREAYGKGRFGQGCLMARRLIESGVPFVEVTHGGLGALGWDTHQDNFASVKTLSAELDSGWATLLKELNDRGLLESTTVIWMGEFGRTPKINANRGRDHFPAVSTCVLAGGGIQGGRAYGRTSSDGLEVEDGKVEIGDVLATLCRALRIDPKRQNISEVGRPIRIAEGTPVEAVLA